MQYTHDMSIRASGYYDIILYKRLYELSLILNLRDFHEAKDRDRPSPFISESPPYWDTLYLMQMQ